MDYFDCPECLVEGYLTNEIEITEEETIDRATTYRGECVAHGEVSVYVNWGND